MFRQRETKFYYQLAFLSMYLHDKILQTVDRFNLHTHFGSDKTSDMVSYLVFDGPVPQT